ncbi:MAG: thymidylate synthase [bacterium]
MSRSHHLNHCPVIKVEGETLPEAWEKSVVECWEKGIKIRTEYDKPNDPPSRDCTMIMEVMDPFKEPRLHRAFPAGLEDLEIYRQEVIYGVHDDWIKPEEGKWEYTYHERLSNYTVPGKSNPIDQINFIVKKLAEAAFSRRAQAVTWKCWVDPKFDDPPCLQRLWLRVFYGSLQLNAHLRSNDAFKAAFMNMFAFTELQKAVAEKISKKTGKKIKVGKYVHVADSYHIYGSYYPDFKGFLDTLKKRSFEERTWPTSFAEPFFEEARKRLKRDRKGNLV